MSKFTTDILQYWDAAYPILAVQTHEEDRVLTELRSMVEEQKIPFYEWSMSQGFYSVQGAPPKPIKDVDGTLKVIREFAKQSIIVLLDFNTFLGNQMAIRLVRDIIPHLEESGKTLIIINPAVAVPVELEKAITLVDFPLPSKDDLSDVLNQVIVDVEKSSDLKMKISDRSALLEATKGMTQAEAKNVLAFTAVKHGDFDEQAIRTVLNEKAGVLKKQQLVTWVDTQVDLGMVGGLGKIKKEVERIGPVFWHPDEALAYGMKPEDFPRGILISGIPGVGKSLIAKAIARYLKVGLVRTDFGRIFGGKVGEPEQNIQRRNKLVESLDPVCDWWDEAEKGLGGVSGKSEANPWEARVGGAILTWHEEHRARVLVIACVNRQELLPPEIMSRFQKVFFADLPVPEELVEIFEIHLNYRGVLSSALHLDKFAEAAKGFSGREVRNAVQAAMQTGFARNKANITDEIVLESIKSINPVSKTRPEDLEKVREWAKKYDVTNASEFVDVVAKPTGRSIKVRS